MTRPVLVLLTCVALVASAGCSGLTTDPGATAPPEPTTQPSTAPETTAATASGTQTASTTSESAEQLAPGVTGDGVSDPLALSNAHVDQLQNTSYTHEIVTESDTANHSHASTVTTLWYETESHWLLANERYGAVSAGAGESAYYGDGQRLYTAQNLTESPSYAAPLNSRGEPSDPAASLPLPRFARDSIYAALSATDTRVVRTESENGPYVVRGYADETTYDGETVTDFHVAATVTDDGVVRELRVRGDTGSASFETEFRFAAVGETTVEEPSWYDDAVNATETGNATAR